MDGIPYLSKSKALVPEFLVERLLYLLPVYPNCLSMLEVLVVEAGGCHTGGSLSSSGISIESLSFLTNLANDD